MRLVSLTYNFHFGIVSQGILQLFNGIYCEGGSHRIMMILSYLRVHSNSSLPNIGHVT